MYKFIIMFGVIIGIGYMGYTVINNHNKIYMSELEIGYRKTNDKITGFYKVKIAETKRLTLININLRKELIELNSRLEQCENSPIRVKTITKIKRVLEPRYVKCR